jgi:hypothetical protein
MLRAVNITSLFIRLGGTALIILGVIIWTGHGAALINAHMIIGILFVLALWVLAGIGAMVGVSWALVTRTSIWGIVVAWFGMLQVQMLPGENHWVIRALHLLIGVVAIGVGEVSAVVIRKRLKAPGA